MKNYLNQIFADNIKKIIISNPLSRENQFRKIDVIKTKNYLVSQYTEKQVFNLNLDENELAEYLLKQAESFKQFNFFGDNNEYCLKFSKKGKLFFSKSKLATAIKSQEGNNRKKNYILGENEIVPPLVDMGVLTKEGKVVASMQHKFKQINRFLEIIDDEIKLQDLSQIKIIDFGCGKSYLTFIIYYYLKFIKKISPTIVGLDLKEDVIASCNKAAQKYGYDGLTFEVGDINGFKPSFQPDMVISLHACDTATDYALFNAVNWNAKMIFSVPCCQHELNSQIKSEELSILTRYGIVQERTCALMTDAIRCNLLQAQGYKVQLMEFVDLAHSPKNLLIRATKSPISQKVRKERLEESERLIKAFNFRPTLYNLFYKK